MTPLFRRAVARAVTLRDGEGTTAVLMFAFSFLAMTAYSVLKPVTGSEYIKDLGAENLPYVYLASGLVIAVLMAGYGWVAARLPARWLIPLTQSAEVALLVGFWFLFVTLTDMTWVSVALYLLGSVLGILLISQFWTLANDIYDARQAKRIFGFIGGGASVGGLIGSGITTALAIRVGTTNLLLVSAALLAACVGIGMIIIRRHGAAAGTTTVETGSAGRGEVVRLLLDSRHLQIVALVISVGAMGALLVDQQLSLVAQWYFGADAKEATATFFASVNVALSAIGLIVQVGLTSRIHRYLGVGAALLILPLCLGATAGIVLASGAIWAVAGAKVVDGSLRYTIDKTSREVLFLPLSPEVRRRVKAFVDVGVERMARALMALLLLVLIQPWGLRLDWQPLSYVSLCLAGLGVGAALLARREYVRSLRRGLQQGAIRPATAHLDVADASTIETLVEQLASPDDEVVVDAIDLLETLDKRNLITPLLLHHRTARIRARALAALGAAEPTVRAAWAPFVEGLLKDDDMAVRAAAVQALALSGMEHAAGTMRRYLSDPDPRVAATAAGVLVRSECEEDRAQGERRLIRLASETGPSAARTRQEVAAGLAGLDRPALRALLVLLVLDSDVDVARAAMRSVRAAGACHPIFVPALVSLLGHRALKREARAALVGCGPDVTGTLAYVLRDSCEQPWVRRHVPATLAQLPQQPAMDALVSVLDDPDGFLRFKSLEAMERLHRTCGALAFDRRSIERRLMQETTRYYNHLVLRANLVRERPGAARALIVLALEEKMARAVDRVYRLLGLLYPWRDVVAARQALEHGGSARARAGAFEYLDNLIVGPLRRRVMPMLDETSLDEQARHAYAVLGTRPRDLDDTLAQLIHDDDDVVSAAAIQFAAVEQRASLQSDLEFVAAHRPRTTGHAIGAAIWALARNREPSAGGLAGVARLPTVVVADTLRRVRLFEFVSVDELFRIASAGRQIKHAPGESLCHPGRVAFVLEGRVRAHDASGSPEERFAPLALGAEDALAGCHLEDAVETVTPVTALELDSSTFLTMVTDHAPLTRGLFRILLARTDERTWQMPASVRPAAGRRAGSGLRPIDYANLLRSHPLFGRATTEELLDLLSVAQEVTVAAGATILEANEPAAICQVIDGQVAVSRNGDAPVVVTPGRTIGVAQTVAGLASGWTATTSAPTRVLRVASDDLFRVLGDRTDLLQSLFSGAITVGRSQSPGD